MLDDFSTELENTESRLDTVMKKMAKVTRMSNGKRNFKYTGWPKKNATLTINNFKKTRNRLKNLCASLFV